MSDKEAEQKYQEARRHVQALQGTVLPERVQHHADRLAELFELPVNPHHKRRDTTPVNEHWDEQK